MDDFERLCERMGVRLLPTNQTPKEPGETHAGNVLRRIYDNHGPEHFLVLLRVFMETREENAYAIISHLVWAISDLMIAYPSWPAAGLRWLEAFDTIDLIAIRDEAHANRRAVAQRAGIASILFRELCGEFSYVPDRKPSLRGKQQICRPLQGPRSIGESMADGIVQALVNGRIQREAVRRASLVVQTVLFDALSRAGLLTFDDAVSNIKTAQAFFASQPGCEKFGAEDVSQALAAILGFLETRTPGPPLRPDLKVVKNDDD